MPSGFWSEKNSDRRTALAKLGSCFISRRIVDRTEQRTKVARGEFEVEPAGEKLEDIGAFGVVEGARRPGRGIYQRICRRGR